MSGTSLYSSHNTKYTRGRSGKRSGRGEQLDASDKVISLGGGVLSPLGGGGCPVLFASPKVN